MKVAISHKQPDSEFKEFKKIPLRLRNVDLSVKSLLKVNENGFMDISIDVIDRKKVEQLEKFKKLAEQSAHDTRAPLQVLYYILKTCNCLSEKERIMLRDSVNSIKNIVQTFLEYSPDKEEPINNQHILVSQALKEILDQKELQYYGKNFEFQYSFDPSLTFTFIYGNATNFERMMSNIINNSVEAFEDNKGAVKISLSVNEDNVEIAVQDNGKGMPREMVERLMRNESVSTTKVGGFGIGTSQIRDALKEFGGKQFIESRPNVGTKITITIPKADDPKWITKQIILHKGNTVVILDDDISMHRIWKERFEPYLHDITLKFFENGQETVDFINSFEEKDKLVLLLDCELRHQTLDGLDVVQNSNMNSYRTILISSIYNRKEIQDKAMSLGIKILPKALIENVRVTIDEKIENKLSFANANVVVLDNEKYFADFISDILKANGFMVDTYYDPRDFMRNLSKYNANIKIITDNYFDDDMTGEAFAEQLSGKGFTNLCVLSGLADNKLRFKYPKRTNFIVKSNEDCGEDLMRWCKKP